LGLGSGSTSTSACIEFASDCIEFVSGSFESFESKLSYEEELACACSSSLTGGRTKLSTCSYKGTCETLSLNWTLHSMMSQYKKKSMSMYPFTPSGYPTKKHSILSGSSAFLFSEEIMAHAHEPKIQKWVTSNLRLLQAS
jgi:hypothetical protein